MNSGGPALCAYAEILSGRRGPFEIAPKRRIAKSELAPEHQSGTDTHEARERQKDDGDAQKAQLILSKSVKPMLKKNHGRYRQE